MNITANMRKNYLLYTSIGFITGAILYTGLPYLANLSPMVEQFSDTIGSFVLRFLGGGYLIMSIIAGITFASYLFPNLSKTFKILAIVFFMFTFMLVVLSGYILGIPFYIYCLYQNYKSRKLDYM